MADRIGEASARRLEEILTEKGSDADRRIAGLRLLTVLAGTALYPLIDPSTTLPRLAWPLLAVSWAYSAWMYFAQPFRRWPALLHGYAFVVSDTVFMLAWVYATGAVRSPFYLLFYLAIFATGFRYTPRVTAVVTATHAAAYVAMAALTGQLAPYAADVATRVVFFALTAMLGALTSRQVIDQAKSTNAALDRAEANRAQAVEASQRARFLAEASKALASSLDYETTLKTVARLVVPAMADHCVVDVLDEEGVVRRVAEAAVDPGDEETLRELRRFPAGEVDGSPVREALRTSESVIVPTIGEAQLAELARVREPEYVRLVRRIGSRTTVTIPLVVHGRAFGAMTFGRSRSDAKYAKAEIGLAEEIGLRAAIAVEHARLYRDAQRAIEKRDEFLSIASHELRTPLNVMQLQTDGLLRQAKRQGDDKILPSLERNRRQVHRLTSLVESLLDVSRVTAGRLALDLGDVDVAAVVEEVVGRMRDEAARSGSTISLAADGPITARADRLRLDQIVTNLLSNAIKYGRGKPIDVALAAPDGRARLTVVDHGIGISADDQARIFDRFERAVSVRHYGGFGLGLWIVRQIVEAHGGSIAIESKVGEGSSFVVELPTAGPAVDNGEGVLNRSA